MIKDKIIITKKELEQLIDKMAIEFNKANKKQSNIVLGVLVYIGMLCTAVTILVLLIPVLIIWVLIIVLYLFIQSITGIFNKRNKKNEDN